MVGVRPLEREGAVEPFDLAVGLRAVGARVFVRNCAQSRVEKFRSVTGPVVAQDTFHRDPQRLVISVCANPKAAAVS
jgi:hypothetical protein